MKEYKLKELLEIKNGKDHSSVGVGNIPIFGSGGIMRYGDEFLYNDESILLPRKGSLSNIQYVNQPFWTVDTIYYSIINKEKAVPYYLYNYLRLLDLSKLNSGTGVPSMTYDSYYNIKVNLPEPKIQKQVANILSALDDKIELNNRINEVLEAKAKLLYDYWFVQFEFPASGASAPLSPLDGSRSPRNGGYKSSGGKMVYNKKLKREIPEGWRDGTFEDISTIVSGSTPSKARNEYFVVNKGTPWITPKDLSLNKGNKFITRGEIDVTESGIKSASLKIMPPGTILLSSRAPIGYIAISRENVTTNQGFKSFVPLDNYSADFVYYCVKNEIPKFEAFSSGSTFREISASVLKTVKISIPPENILRCFDNLIKPIFEKQNILEKQNQHLSSLRDWFLPMLMNGQVGVERAYEIVDGELGMVAETGDGKGKENENG